MPKKTDPKPVKLAARLPKEEARNGLATIHGDVLRPPLGVAYIVARVVSTERLVSAIDGVQKPTLVIDHVEGLPEGELARAGEQLLAWARAAREGDDEDALISRDEFVATVRGRDVADPAD